MNVLFGGAGWISSMANAHFNKIVIISLVNALLARYLEIRYVGFGKTIHLTPDVSAALEIEGGIRERSQGEGEDRKLSILSQNVWCHYGQQWYAPSARKRLTRLQDEIISRQYDVVMLQELFMLRFGPFAITSNFENLVRELQRNGYRSITDPRHSLPFFGQNSGLVIFSRLPLFKRSSEHLFDATGEKVCNKGFVHAQLSLGPDSQLHIVNTHLDSKNKPKNVQVLVGGDWNVCSRKSKDNGEAYAQLSATLSPLRDAYGGIFGEEELAPSRRPNTKFWVRGKKKGKEGGAAIDHAFFTGCEDRTVVSDHLGMEMEMRVAGRSK